MLKASNVTIDESRRFRGETSFYGASVGGCVSFLGAVGLAGGGSGGAGGWFMGWRRLGAALCPYSVLRFS